MIAPEIELLTLNGTKPIRLIVRDTASIQSRTRRYSIIADYGWAESILCSESYYGVASDMCQILSAAIGCECSIPAPIA